MVSIPVFLKSSHVNAHLKSSMYLYAGATMAIFLVRSVYLFTLIVHLDGATRGACVTFYYGLSTIVD